MLSYEKMTSNAWDNAKWMPKCPSKGAFEVLYDNNTYWILDGKRHREDGPAVEWTNGEKWWYLHGQRYSKEEWEIEAMRLGIKNGII